MRETSIVQKIFSREILDSRGNPTVEVDVTLSDGTTARASVPSGASTGSKEAVELRDGDKNRFMGKGVLKVNNAINQLVSSHICGLELNQGQMDQRLIELDGTYNKSNLGANAILAVSIAFARAQANQRNLPLYLHLNRQFLEGRKTSIPVPFVNIINGGVHADNGLDLQEFMISPVGIRGFPEQLRAVTEVFQRLKILLKELGLSTNVGDEGGFAPDIKEPERAIELIMTAISHAGYNCEQIKIAIDAAASEFYRDGYYHTMGSKLDSDGLVEYYLSMARRYPIISLEDPMAEDDMVGWSAITREADAKLQLVGDDLFVTHEQLFRQGVGANLANAILIKPNQVGSVSETFSTIRAAFECGYGVMVSHRSGETNDNFISHMAVACGCGQIKTGSVCRGERVAKYNELLRINELL